MRDSIKRKKEKGKRGNWLTRLTCASVFLIFLFSFSNSANAQTVRPDWLNDGLRDLQYSYIEVVSGDAATASEARDRAATAIVQRRNLTAGAKVNVHVENGAITTSGDQKMIVAARVLDEYAERLNDGNWRVYLLVQTLKHPQYDYEPVTVTDSYPFSYKMFIPGMAQLDKGQTTKGVIMIGAEVAMVGGIVAFEGIRSTYVNRIASTHNTQQRIAYTNTANTCSNMRNICIAGAAAVYVWSFVDALVSKAPKHVLLGAAEMHTTPYATTDGIGIAMKINF